MRFNIVGISLLVLLDHTKLVGSYRSRAVLEIAENLQGLEYSWESQ